MGRREGSFQDGQQGMCRRRLPGRRHVGMLHVHMDAAGRAGVRQLHHLCSSPCTVAAAACPKAEAIKNNMLECPTTASSRSGRLISHCGTHEWARRAVAAAAVGGSSDGAGWRMGGRQ